MARKLALLVITCWVGSLWMTGITASVLFDVIQDRQLAGEIAGRLFAIVSYIGMAAGLFLLAERWMATKQISFKQSYCWIVLAMLLLILLGYFGIQAHLAALKADVYPVPVMQSAHAKQFAMWHGVSGVVYLVECLLGVALVFKATR